MRNDITLGLYIISTAISFAIIYPFVHTRMGDVNTFTASLLLGLLGYKILKRYIGDKI